MLSDGIGPRPELDHYYADDFITRIVKYPRSRIYFITVRCPKQVKPWNKIGKSNDWIRRYSECYYIVRGTKHGDHFHLLAGVKKGSKMSAKKGIHFHMTTLSPDTGHTSPEEWDELRISKEKAIYYMQQKFEYQTLNLHAEESALISKIVKMITRYWVSKAAKATRNVKMTEKAQDIHRILTYMEKNLLEPREDSDIDLYRDYMYK